VRPDLVVGDLRLSLAVSTAVAKIPYANLINAYWSPFGRARGVSLPDHPIVRLLGVKLAERYFPKALPHVFAHFARPVNALRKQHRLAGARDVAGGPDPRRLHAVPRRTGAGADAQPAAPPALPRARAVVAAGRAARLVGRARSPAPTVYVTLGSSGRVERLRAVIEAAAALGLQVLVATAGRTRLDAGRLPPHVYVADFLPGHLAARRAQRRGVERRQHDGLPGARRAAAGAGIAFNLDQYLAMTAIEDAGAGLLLRAGSVDREQLRGALGRLLSEPSFSAAAAGLGDEFARWDAGAAFASFVEAVGGLTRRAPGPGRGPRDGGQTRLRSISSFGCGSRYVWFDQVRHVQQAHVVPNQRQRNDQRNQAAPVVLDHRQNLSGARVASSLSLK
jgi:UDP:flavonoid glycosyltransferase YjiC (YdhE family)